MTQTAAQVTEAGTVAHMTAPRCAATPVAPATVTRPRPATGSRATAEVTVQLARSAAEIVRSWFDAALLDTLAVTAAADGAGFLHAPSCGAAGRTRTFTLREVGQGPYRYGQCNSCDDRVQTPDSRVKTLGLLRLTERDLEPVETGGTAGPSLSDLLSLQRRLHLAQDGIETTGTESLEPALSRITGQLQQRISGHMSRLADGRWLLLASFAAQELGEHPKLDPGVDGAEAARFLRRISAALNPEALATSAAAGDPDGRWYGRLVRLAARIGRSDTALLVSETNRSAYAVHMLVPAIQALYPTWQAGPLSVTEAPEGLVRRAADGRASGHLALRSTGPHPQQSRQAIELAWTLRAGESDLTAAYTTALLLQPQRLAA